MSMDKPVDDKAFLENQLRHARLQHDVETCGTCYQRSLWAVVAREMLEREDYSIVRWADEGTRRWRESKFVKLWQEEEAAGRDPKQAFKARGWQT